MSGFFKANGGVFSTSPVSAILPGLDSWEAGVGVDTSELPVLPGVWDAGIM